LCQWVLASLTCQNFILEPKNYKKLVSGCQFLRLMKQKRLPDFREAFL
jgi:hypothetical protein